MTPEDELRLSSMKASDKVKVVSDFIGVIDHVGHSPIKESDNVTIPVETANMLVKQKMPLDVKLDPLPVPISITKQPAATVTVKVGEAINLTATATGATTHKWYKGSTKIKDGTGNNATFSVAVAAAGDAGTYHVEFQNATTGPVKSTNSVVTVNPAA